jgi:hypothetical protein
MKSRAGRMACFGWRCWHAYTSNPSVAELYVSVDGFSFVKWCGFEAEMSSEIQFFKIDPLPTRYKYIKLKILETFGANKVYINQVFLLDECPIGSKFSPEKPSPKHNHIWE